MKVTKILPYIKGLPKTIYFNLKYFDFFTAVKLPVLVSQNVLLLQAKGRIVLPCDTIKTGMVKLGFGNVGIFDFKRSRAIWNVSGNVVFMGTCYIGHGSKISVNKNGTLILGSKFAVGAETTIVCNKKISFGNDCIVSWDTLIMDTDFHQIYDEKHRIINYDKEVKIGNNVWTGCRCTILKGAEIADNTIIGANSTVSSKISGCGQIIAGNPVKIIKTNVHWSYME